MDFAQIELMAEFMDQYGKRVKKAFSDYFEQEKETPTEIRFMNYLQEALTSSDFVMWQEQYEALKRDIMNYPETSRPFPWL